MEAIKKHGFYLPRWRLAIEFSCTQEQKFWDEERLTTATRVLVNQSPWKDKRGNPLNDSLKISVVSYSAVHPDYGPETVISLEHEDLLLSVRQLWTYEKWARKISQQLEKKITHVLSELSMSSNIVWKCSVQFSSPVSDSSSRSSPQLHPND